MSTALYPYLATRSGVSPAPRHCRSSANEPKDTLRVGEFLARDIVNHCKLSAVNALSTSFERPNVLVMSISHVPEVIVRESITVLKGWPTLFCGISLLKTARMQCIALAYHVPQHGTTSFAKNSLNEQDVALRAAYFTNKKWRRRRLPSLRSNLRLLSCSQLLGQHDMPSYKETPCIRRGRWRCPIAWRLWQSAEKCRETSGWSLPSHPGEVIRQRAKLDPYTILEALTAL